MSRVEISFFRGEVRIGGLPIELPAKELELLFTVAAAGTINGEHLMDILWPDADGDAAHNAFRVCLHRLRKHLHNGQVIRRAGRAYVLDDGIDVDLYANSQDMLGEIRAGHGSRARLGAWFEPFERLLWAYAQRARKCRATDLVTAQ